MPPRTANPLPPPAPLRFPLALAAAAIIATGLAPVAAALAIQWGAAPPAPDALQMAWLYVNVSMTVLWFVLWPATALRPAPRAALVLQLLTLCVAAIPAMGVSAFLSGAAPQAILTAAALQLAMALLALAAMAHAPRLGPAPIAATLASLALAAPVAAYLWAEFFAAAPQGPIAWIPAFAAASAARGAPAAWWFTTACTAAAMALLAAARPGTDQAAGSSRTSTK